MVNASERVARTATVTTSFTAKGTYDANAAHWSARILKSVRRVTH
jgi:hypothetical protein